MLVAAAAGGLALVAGEAKAAPGGHPVPGTNPQPNAGKVHPEIPDGEFRDWVLTVEQGIAAHHPDPATAAQLFQVGADGVRRFSPAALIQAPGMLSAQGWTPHVTQGGAAGLASPGSTPTPAGRVLITAASLTPGAPVFLIAGPDTLPGLVADLAGASGVWVLYDPSPKAAPVPVPGKKDAPAPDPTKPGPVQPKGWDPSLVLAPATLTLAPGATQSVTASQPQGDTGFSLDVTISATWTSDDPSVATVAGGQVTAVAVGETQIVAQYTGNDGSQVEGQASVTVSSDAPAPPSPSPAPSGASPLVLSPTGLVLGTKGDTGQLTATQDGQDVTVQATWTSSDPSVATVDGNGLISGVATGTATIQATLGQASGTASAAVSASLQKIPNAGATVDVSPADLSLWPNDASTTVMRSGQLTATQTNADGSTLDVTSSATWTSDDPSVATVDASGSVTAVAPGSTQVHATTLDGPAGASSVFVADAGTTATQGARRKKGRR